MPARDLHRQIQRQAAETVIRDKLVELIRLASAHGLDIERLMRDAIDFCDPEPPFSN